MLTPSQHRRAGELFDRLREVPPETRDRALADACGPDSVLREYVAALLAADDEAPSGFLGQGALHVAAGLLADKTPPIGLMLGHYRLGERIGAGGMGTVYRGHDTRLDRTVAIKLLSPAFVGDRDRVQRFQREWRANSRLNHPNIVSLYDAGFDQGHHYIATEFVEGKTLRALGSPPLPALIDIAIQICTALEAAHGAGILHRDIKPDNIMVRTDGIVKVLDFGLAKVQEPSSDASLLTRPGDLAGTVAYLAPEQILGKPASAASDLYSLGVVLYEVATGRPLFAGPTDGAICEAILNRQPEPPPVQAGFAEILMRLLDKEPEYRFQTAADLRASLRRLSRGEPSPPVKRKRRVPWKPVAAAVLLAAAVLTTAAMDRWPWRPAPQARLPVRFERLTDSPGEKLFPQLNPDATQFIYASAPQGQWDIFLQRTGGATAINLTQDSPANDTQPALSPDAQHIAFRSERGGGGIFVMDATGENPRRVSSRGYHPAWSPDGKSIVYSTESLDLWTYRNGPTSQLFILDLASGAERKLSTADAIQPNWSPHGDRIAYWGLAGGGQRNIFTISAKAAAAVPVPLISDPPVDWNPVWSPSGDELYFLSDRGGTMNLWRIPIQESSGAAAGAISPVTLPAAYTIHFTTAASGRAFAFVQGQLETALYSVGFDPARQEIDGNIVPVIAGTNARSVYNFSFSPDGRQLVHDTIGEAQEDIWIVDLDGSRPRRLTSDKFNDRTPAWSPDGKEILFFSDRSGTYEEWSIQVDGSGLRQLTRTGGMQRSIWSPDGSRIIAARFPGAPAFLDPHAKSIITAAPPAPGLDAESGTVFFNWPKGTPLLVGEQVSGNGRLVLYWLADGRLEQLEVTGRRPVMLPGSRHFVFSRGGDCLLYDIAQRREKLLFSVAPNRIYAIDVSRPGRIYLTQTLRKADIWLGRMDDVNSR